MPLKVTVTRKEPGVFIVSCIGSLDSETYKELEQKLKPVLVPSTNALILDMEYVNYISSMGVSVVLMAKKAVEANKGTFVMTKLQKQVKTVFDIIKALPPVCVFETVEEADRYLAEMQRRVLEKGGEDEKS